MKRLAVERLLEMIGEAARALTSECRERFVEIPWADVIGLRSVLAHHYHRVDPDQVWTIASIEVPRLVQQLANDG